MKMPPKWTLKNLRQFYMAKLKLRIETDEYDYEEWVYG